MLPNIREAVARTLTNIPGWRTDRKLVILESDDWGAIRMSSKESLSKLAEQGVNVQNCHYVQHDALASEDDLTLLFDLLNSYKDSKGNHPVITANTIMANPDFEKIKEHEFNEYHFELFTKTLEKYPNHKNCFNLWKQGLRERLFHPQFHGREHLQVGRWMNFLKKSDSDTRKAFEVGVFGLSTQVTSEKRESYLAAYDWDDPESREYVLTAVSEGLSMFKSLFGYSSLSSIAPNYIWQADVEEVMYKQGVRYLQGSRVQKSSQIGKNGFQYNRHYTGQYNKFKQLYLVRNCKFEPSSNPDKNWVDSCMRDIKTAFFWKKPAIIEIHRVNFVGFISPDNRDKNLRKFDQLLEKIIKKWPEVEFLTSDELGQTIEDYE